MIDLSIYESGDGGELILKRDDIELTAALYNQVYLALFGGNVEQETKPGNVYLEERFDWWGNVFFNTENQFNSQFERELRHTVITGAGLQSLEAIATNDLKFLRRYADIEVSVEMIDYNKIEINITLSQPNKNEILIKYVWDIAKKIVIDPGFVGDTPVNEGLTDWILRNGYWDDFGYWRDEAYWQDNAIMI